MGIRVGIDTGGTFTDLVAVDEEAGRWHVAKVPSNPKDPVSAVAAALEAAGLDPERISIVVVGTTIGINAVLTRTGARVLYLTTKGFEDVPFIQRISRKYHYDFRWRKPTPLVHRPDCIGVDERLDEEGRELVPLATRELERVLESVESRADGDRLAIAVCFLFSYLDPEHELATRTFLEERTGLPVSLSHEVAPIWREYERGTTAIVDAYLKPLLDEYVSGLGDALVSQGISSRPSLLKSNGGHALAAEARERPAHLLLSGIAGGAIGGAHFARLAGTEKGIVVDMGGTSCDVCLIVGGEPLYSSDFEIEYGFPVSVPSVSTKTIGAGGGSIGWVDSGGFLQVGPGSAGADPGPACYGRGGEETTLTDANLALGRLNPDFFLGGRLALDASLSRAALGRLAAKLGRDAVDVAASMVRVANENMANAIRIVTVEQGIDPREFAIVAMGGAGPTHAAEIAAAIGIGRVIVPANPGLASAFGALAAQVRVDAVKSVYLTDVRATAAEVSRLFTELESRSVADFEAQAGGVASHEVRRSIAMRYQGQNYETEVTVPGGELADDDLPGVYEQFARLYESFYGYRLDGIPIELVRLQVVVVGEDRRLPELVQGGGPAARDESREVWFPEHGFVATPVVRRDSLELGSVRGGPAIVEEMDSTIVVPPAWRLESGRRGVLELVREEG
ncbi:MAG: hydantoinase/oxoprolinase family protein [Thermoleophilia bacterium]|nr:hydantoinase/oxoprolinase family protein [Thermoleophilia bacterium]